MEYNDLIKAESQKTKDWIKDLIKHYVSMDSSSGSSDKRDRICWSLYHNELNKNRFDYLLEVGKFSLPAKPRHIPLQKHLLDSLTSQQTRRPFVFSTITINHDAVEEKSTKMLRAIIKDLLLIVKSKHYDNLKKVAAIQQQMAQIKEQLNQEPENEEDLMAKRKIQNLLPTLEIEVSAIIEEIESDDKLDKEQIAQFRRYYRYNFKDYKEEIGQKLAWKLRNELGVKNISTQNFISHIVTGKQYYYVDHIRGEKWPRYEPLDSTKVRYPRVPGIRWIQDGPWVKIREKMSFQQVYKEFGREIVEEYGQSKLQELSRDAVYEYSNDGQFVSTPEGDMFMGDSVYQGTFENSQGIDVERVFVKVPRKINVKYSPNPHEKGKYFRHFITDGRKPINEDDYIFSKGTFTNKQNKKVTHEKSDVAPFRRSRGEYMKDYEINDVYEGVCINNEIYVRLRKKETALRNIDSYNDVKLPVVGRTFSTMSEQPYSLIWTTKDLQELYDIVYTMRELMVALSGTKTMVYDMAQKPGDMEDDEWEYQKKKGILSIETMDAAGRPKRSIYNQWQMIDLSLSQSVQYLDNMLLQLEEAMGNIIGVPRQRQGQVVNTDQVGTYKESIQRAQLITEILYQQHDEIEAKALSQLLNLAVKYSVKEGDELELNDQEMGRDFLRIPRQFIDKVWFDVMVLDNTDQQRKMEEIREFMGAAYKDGQLPFSAMLKVWDSDTLASMKNKIMDFVERAEEMEQLNRQKDRESAERMKEMETQFRGQLEQFSAESQQRIASLKAEVEREKTRVKQISDDRDRELKEKEIDLNARLKFMELVNEQASEQGVLQNNDKHATMGERISLLQLQMQSLFNLASIGSKDSIDREKIKVEKEKTRKLVKEHVSDK